MTIPLAPIIGLIPMVTPAIQAVAEGATPLRIIDSLAWNTLGVANVDNPGTPIRFDINKCISNITPLVIGIAIHKLVGGSPLNFNAVLSRAKVPFIRI